jgi:isopenicillin N synthase-like dioxygenase
MNAELGLSPPIIDVAPLAGMDAAARITVARALRQACATTGFFYAANHGIDPALVEGLLAQGRRFFDQPEAAKLRVSMKNSRWNRGFDGIGNQQLDAATGFDRKESYFVGIDYGADHPLVRAGTPYHGPNQWPENLPGWRERVLDYFGAVEQLSRRLMNGIALSLDLPWGYFEPTLTEHVSSLRLLHYPPHPNADPAREVGCGAHTDWGAITILAQDEIGGLEIQLPDSRWVPARPLPGAFIVNIGDMMQRWTNDLYVSTPHRVLNRSPHDRYSAAFFFDPSYYTQVECLPTCCDATRPAQYPPITSGEHLAAMYRKTYGAAA